MLQIIVLLRFVVQEKYELKTMFTAAIVFISGYYLWTASEHRRLLLFWLLILGAWKIPFQKVIKVFVRVIGPMMIVTTFCAVVGLIDDYTYTRADFIRHSFGIVSPTNYGAMVFFLVLCWWYLRREKMNWKEILGVFGIAVFLHLGCHARCSTVLTAVAGILMGMEKMLKETDLCNISGSYLSDDKKAVNEGIPLEFKKNRIFFGYIRRKNDEPDELVEELLEFLNSKLN